MAIENHRPNLRIETLRCLLVETTEIEEDIPHCHCMEQQKFLVTAALLELNSIHFIQIPDLQQLQAMIPSPNISSHKPAQTCDFSFF